MVGCSVPGCTSRSEKGFFLKQLPTDPIKRAMWVDKLPDRDWSLQYLRICELHFENDQFETLRIDGKKKLKTCALPTIFHIKNKNKIRRKKYSDNLHSEQIQEDQNNEKLEMLTRLNDDCLNKSCSKLEDEMLKNHIKTSHHDENMLEEESNVSTSYCGTNEIIHLKNMDIKNNTNLSKAAIVNLLIETSFGTEPRAYTSKEIKLKKQENYIKDMDKLIMENESYKLKNKKLEEDIVQILLIRKANEERLQARIAELEEKLMIADKYLRKIQKTQQKEVNKIKEKKQLISKGLNVNHVFNDDQLKYLSRKETTRFYWSNETLNTAVQLKLILGHKKFKDLLLKKYPLPSIRTVSRRLERFKVAHFQKDVIQFLKDNNYSVCMRDLVDEDMDIDTDTMQHIEEVLHNSNVSDDRISEISEYNNISNSQLSMEVPLSQQFYAKTINDSLQDLNYYYINQGNSMPNISSCKINDPKLSLDLNLEFANN